MSGFTYSPHLIPRGEKLLFSFSKEVQCLNFLGFGCRWGISTMSLKGIVLRAEP